MTLEDSAVSELEDVPLPREEASARMRRVWAKRVAKGEARAVPVFVEGEWSLLVLRGNKRVLQFSIPSLS